MIHVPDQVDLARAESEAAAAEMAMAFDQLTDRLLLLGDRRAGELAARALVTLGRVIDAEQAMALAALETLQRVHAKQLRVLGSDPVDAARRLLLAAATPSPRALWPNP